MDIGLPIRHARERKRLTQTEVADAIGASRQALAMLEANRGRVTTLGRFETFMRVHVSGLKPEGSIVAEIKATRLRAELSLREIAEQAKISVNTLRGLEGGSGSITSLLAVLRALAPLGEVRVVNLSQRRRALVTVARDPNPDRDPHDYYSTPPAITRLLLDHEEFDPEHPVLEPAVGEARAIDLVLKERGYSTVCFDLNGTGAERRSFFDIEESYQTIVTNPPYRLHQEFILHAKRIAVSKIAFLLPLNYLTGASRYADLWTDRGFPLARVHVLNRGIDFRRSDPLADTFAPSQMYCAWFVFERGHQGPPHINWIDSNQWIARSTRKGIKVDMLSLA